MVEIIALHHTLKQCLLIRTIGRVVIYNCRAFISLATGKFTLEMRHTQR